MRRRNFELEVIEIILAAAVIILAVILCFRASTLSVLFPVTFALAAILSALYGLEGIFYNRNRIVKKNRVVVFGILAAILIALTVVSAITVFGR
ncbi:MAG: hypothetical protein J5794_03775 [Lachnospiraceae bacterium]|nr:hypothetical protein [Lachnospiraceae bacterium]